MFIIVLGAVQLGTMALVSPFLQNVIGMPPLTAGRLLAARGAGTMICMLLVSRLMRLVEVRWLLSSGLSLLAFSMWLMSGYTDMTSSSAIIMVSMIQGFGLGLVFVPRQTMAFATLSPHLRTQGTAMMTLMRNLSGSIGISVVIAHLTGGMSVNYAELAERITPFNPALWWPDVAAIYDVASQSGLAHLDALLRQQAAIIAYGEDFRLLMIAVLCALPFSLIGRSTRKMLAAPAGGRAPAE
jgi:DHA2 family multidrug resistance protein